VKGVVVTAPYSWRPGYLEWQAQGALEKERLQRM
jgi:hypothetical protein